MSIVLRSRKTLAQRYRNTLRKYGTLSHLWDFGVPQGALNYYASYPNVFLSEELVTNGGFDSDTGWTKQSTWAVSGGFAVAAATVSSAFIYQTAVAVVAGRSYSVKFSVSDCSSGSVAPVVGDTIGSYASAAGTYSQVVIAGGNSQYGIGFRTSNGPVTLKIDNISVKEVYASAAAEFLAQYPLWHLYQDTAGTVPACKITAPVGLCLDTGSGAVMLGPELIGDWTSGWTSMSGGVVVMNSGKLRITNSIAQWGYAYKAITTVVGRSYLLLPSFSAGTAGTSLLINIGTTPGGTGVAGSVDATKQRVFVASGATTYISMYAGSGVMSAYTDYSSISVQEVIGAHASQATTTKRPILSGRVNLLTASENLATWTFFNVSGTATRVGNTLTFGASATDRCLLSSGGSTIAAGASYKRAVTLSGSGSVRLYTFDGTGATSGAESITLSATPITYTSTTALINGGSFGGVGIYNNAAGTAGAVVNFINADLRPTNSPTNIPAYQRVTSATDYDTVGFPVRALFDGVDDCLVVPSLDLSMTDKVTVVAGVTKLSDAATGIVCELTNDLNSYNGAFYLAAPRSSSYSEPIFSSKGNSAVLAGQTLNSFPAPRGMVLSATASISTDSAILSVNDSVYGTSAADQGTGNFSAGPLNIGARNGGASAPFNGAIQSLAVIGNLLPDGEVQILEASANAAMGKVY